jgi:transposase-like protein
MRLNLIKGKVALDSVIYSDGWRGYYGLVDVGYSKHFRVHHGANEFARDWHCLSLSVFYQTMTGKVQWS